MKAIINGKRYDTEKAILVGKAGSDGNISVDDFSYWEAGLYKTPRSGVFFLAGTGGAMTRWATPIGNNGRSGGSGVIPLDREEARLWAERFLPAEIVEEHFGDMIEDA